jgi:hypothetical protein
VTPAYWPCTSEACTLTEWVTAHFLLTPHGLISFFLVCVTPMFLFLKSQELNLRLKSQAHGQLVSHMLEPYGFEDATDSFIHYIEKFIPTILCIPKKLSFQILDIWLLPSAIVIIS